MTLLMLLSLRLVHYQMQLKILAQLILIRLLLNWMRCRTKLFLIRLSLLERKIVSKLLSLTMPNRVLCLIR
nr:MAG TPA: hypothetical protein [Bacteriophage sp.]